MHEKITIIDSHEREQSQFNRIYDGQINDEQWNIFHAYENPPSNDRGGSGPKSWDGGG
jgi:hypothetical protein